MMHMTVMHFDIHRMRTHPAQMQNILLDISGWIDLEIYNFLQCMEFW